GEKLTAQSPTLRAKYEEQISDLQGNPSWKFAIQASEAISLGRGMTGYYIAAVCGANCHSAYDTVFREEQGFRYRIEVKVGGRKEKAIEIAKAAIDNQRLNK
ncbi:MAG: hypothetical protein F6K28_38650, partial [Microcoleus sp. SIO2G3]|nr:hypothetical protein [Microcoleus sp. SIO2G3]